MLTVSPLKAVTANATEPSCSRCESGLPAHRRISSIAGYPAGYSASTGVADATYRERKESLTLEDFGDGIPAGSPGVLALLYATRILGEE
jgi:hypothetical protein